MKLEKNITDISMFEKKTISLHELKEKLIQYKKINDKFVYWDYKEKNDILQDDISNYVLVLVLTAIPSIIFELIMISKGMFLLSLPMVLLGNLTVMNFLRNLKFGIWRSRYKKWQMLRKDIKNIMNDNNNIFAILLETEIKLKNLQKTVNENLELKKIMDKTIHNNIKDIKTIFANYENNPGNIFSLIEKSEKNDSVLSVGK